MAVKVVIIGAGIGGLSCALHLLRQGCEVTAMEREKGSPDKVCGEGLLPFGVARMSRLGLLDQVRTAGRPFHGLVYHHAGQTATADFAEGAEGIGIERGALDQIMREACGAHANFQLKTGCRLRPGETHDGDLLIAADGVASAWARRRGQRVRSSNRLGLRFRVKSAPPDRVHVHFFKFGEVYLTPTSPEDVSVAVLVDPTRAGVSGNQLKPWAEAFFRDAFPEYAHAALRDMATRGPICRHAASPREDIHLIGDANRTFDPISGAGMSYALICAELAATHLHDPAAYYRALAPVNRAVGAVTDLVLLFSGGGPRTRLMLNRLARHGDVFSQLVHHHDGRLQPLKLAPPVLRLLIP